MRRHIEKRFGLDAFACCAAQNPRIQPLGTDSVRRQHRFPQSQKSVGRVGLGDRIRWAAVIASDQHLAKFHAAIRLDDDSLTAMKTAARLR